MSLNNRATHVNEPNYLDAHNLQWAPYPQPLQKSLDVFGSLSFNLVKERTSKYNFGLLKSRFPLKCY